MIPAAERLAAGLPRSVCTAFEQTYSVLVEECACDAYVKTIYVGFTIDGALVAAVYPRGDHLEIAVALPEDIAGSEFKDATHLTWPTMPVAVDFREGSDLQQLLGHLRAASERVREGEHQVRRPNDHFIDKAQRGANRRGSSGR